MYRFLSGGENRTHNVTTSQQKDKSFPHSFQLLNTPLTVLLSHNSDSYFVNLCKGYVKIAQNLVVQ